MLRLEARNAETPIERKPPWIKTRVRTGPEYTALQHLVKSEGLHTVCQEAGCPNIFECWEDREATFLIGGDQCTRRCDFCQIDTGKPLPLDRDEPRRVAESVAAMGLRYATVTGVARDDQPDGGVMAVRADRQGDPRRRARLRRRTARPRLQRGSRAARRGVQRRARGVRAQPGDGAADLQADPARLPLRALARRASPGARGRPGHEVQPDPRHGRDPRGDRAGDGRPACRRRRPADDHPVPAPLRAAPPGGPLGAPGRVRRAPRGSARRWASPASCPARSSARRTAREGCTPRPSSSARPRRQADASCCYLPVSDRGPLTPELVSGGAGRRPEFVRDRGLGL